MIFNKIKEYYLLNYGHMKTNIDFDKLIYRRLDKYLEEEGLITKTQLFSMYEDLLDVRSVNISLLDFKKNILNIVDYKWMEHYRMVPFEETSKTIKLLISDPFDIEKIFLVERIFNKNVEIYISTINEINQFISLISINEGKSVINDNNKIDKILESIIVSALNQNVSDIHFNYDKNKCILYYRIDGILKKFMVIDDETYVKVLNKIKIMSNIDIGSSSYPNDGHFTFEKANVKTDIRVSTMPTLSKERMVLRFLNNNFKNYQLDKLGFNNKQLMDIVSSFKGGGLIFITGPTGSGKTTTLYSMLEYLKSQDKNIMTVEDPIEKKVDGITQIPLNRLDYAVILKNIIRQDPDIIMIGEIRDEETAMLAIKLAQTGHLVLSTIHSQDSIGVIARLENLKVPRYLILDTLRLVISQRLIIKQCNDCIDLPETGCKKCLYTGYKGRMMISEVIKFDKKTKKIISEDNYREILEEVKQEDLFKQIVRELYDDKQITYDELIYNGLTI